MRTRPGQQFQAPVALTLDDYLALFEAVRDERAIGEASTSYLRSIRAPERIKDAVPHAKLIAVLRNPVDRAFSRYSHLVTSGDETQTFSQAVAAELAPPVPGVAPPLARYVEPGFYGAQLGRYLELFDREQLSVHFFEDLVQRPEPLLRELFCFLDVDPSFVPALGHHNVTRYPAKSASIDRLVRRVPRKAFLVRIIPPATRARAGRSLRRWNRRLPEFPSELRRELVEVYRDDIRRTEEIVGPRSLCVDCVWLTGAGREPASCRSATQLPERERIRAKARVE